MNFSELKIGDLTAKLPIIQGGMGVGISLSGLASSVANQGGIGVISGIQLGFRDKDFSKNPFETNLKYLKKEIATAREKSPTGIIGVNLMVAMENYDIYVQEAVKANIDLIISGAGLPLSLPKLVKDSSTKIVPIVSSGRAAKIIIRSWEKDGRLPDAIIVEGPLAGGHLGFKMKELVNNSYQSLEEIVLNVKEVVTPFEEKHNIKIPVIAAGGIATSEDVKRFLELGADGVQVGTRFIPTEECDAHPNYKQHFVNATESDMRIIKSPVGMPGRAISNQFLDKVTDDGVHVKDCSNCIAYCDNTKTPYCISRALINSANGQSGLVFSGAKINGINKISTVKDVINDLFELA